MNIISFFKVIGVDINITVRPGGNCQASGHRCETQSGNILASEWGAGSTPAKAIADYARLISGKRLIVNAWDVANRKEYDVPNLVPQKRSLKKKKKTSRKKK